MTPTDAPPPALGELARLAIDDVNEYASAYYAYVMHGAGSGRKTAMDAAYNAFADKLDALVALASGGAADTARLDALAADPSLVVWSTGYRRHPGAWTYTGEGSVVQLAPSLREAIDAARSLTPERPADATPAPVRRGRLSEHPCDRCKQHEVYVRQDSNDDADYTIHCYGCGHHYRVDGPDA